MFCVFVVSWLVEGCLVQNGTFWYHLGKGACQECLRNLSFHVIYSSKSQNYFTSSYPHQGVRLWGNLASELLSTGGVGHWGRPGAELSGIEGAGHWETVGFCSFNSQTHDFLKIQRLDQNTCFFWCFFNFFLMKIKGVRIKRRKKHITFINLYNREPLVRFLWVYS